MSNHSYRTHNSKLKTKLRANRKNDNKLEIKEIGITVYCPYIDKDIIIKNPSFNSNESDCEVCGSHGYIDFTFSCSCGYWHTIKIESW